MQPTAKKWDRRSLRPVLGILLATITIDLDAQYAKAQWYPGSFWGYGGYYTPPSVDVINRAAIDRIANAQADRTPAGYVDDSNAYYRKSRDPEFFEKYDIETRRAMEARVARKPPIQGGTSRPAPSRSNPPTPLVPIASFFDKSDRLVWPSDSPTTGDLGPKRVASDRASLVVLAETRQQGLASLASVTEARKKLLDYGQPALTYVSEHLTPRVVDTFHLFLLSLYEALQQAATPPKGSPSTGR